MNHLPDSFINRFDIRAICLHCRRLPIPLQQEQYEKCRWIDHRNIFCCLDTKYLLKEHNKLLKHLLHLKKKILKTNSFRTNNHPSSTHPLS